MPRAPVRPSVRSPSTPFQLCLRLDSVEHASFSTQHQGYCKVYVGPGAVDNSMARAVWNAVRHGSTEDSRVLETHRLHRTRVQPSSQRCHVHWGERLVLGVSDLQQECVTIVVKARGVLPTASTLGYVVVPLAKLRPGEVVDAFFGISKRSSQLNPSHDCIRGRLHMQLQLQRVMPDQRLSRPSVESVAAVDPNMVAPLPQPQQPPPTQNDLSFMRDAMRAFAVQYLERGEPEDIDMDDVMEDPADDFRASPRRPPSFYRSSSISKDFMRESDAPTILLDSFSAHDGSRLSVLLDRRHARGPEHLTP